MGVESQQTGSFFHLFFGKSTEFWVRRGRSISAIGSGGFDEGVEVLVGGVSAALISGGEDESSSGRGDVDGVLRSGDDVVHGSVEHDVGGV